MIYVALILILIIPAIVSYIILAHAVKTASFMDDYGHTLPDDYDWSYKPEKVEVYICEDYRWSAEELEEEDAS